MKLAHKIKNFLAIAIFGIGGAILAIINWSYGIFGRQSLLKILFHLQEPLDGSNWDTFLPCVGWMVGAFFVFGFLGWISILLFRNPKEVVISFWKIKIKLALDGWSRHAMIPAFLVFAISLVSVWNFFDTTEFVKSRVQTSKIYEQQYVEPSTANIVFPEEKRNLVYIYLESMETTYMSVEDGGAEYAEFIPGLRSLAVENENFSASGTINGAYSTTGTDWTMGALVAQTCGIPLNMLIDGNDLGFHTDLYPGAYSIGQILDKEGYNQVFLMGSAGGFAGRDSFFTNHGNYQIMDYYYAIDQGWIDAGYYVWWGFEDEILIEHAKEEMINLAETGEPFNLTLLTVDTHFYNGYKCRLCEDEFGDDQYANVIACSDRQIMNFVQWIQQQDFYENTTIVICGDHPTMDKSYVSRTTGLEEDATRQVYVTVINSACEYTLDYDREFTTIDMYPTTLAALGADIEGDQLGLGTNLYSETPTLLETMGLEDLNKELAKSSKYYENYIIYGVKESSEE